ncbi:DNA polymerase III subunit delta [Paratractidigestivibacter sp.]|uniref:DNA polymerase III subunit delta n=1 Tax=Paratractidigestivibacter sp. TaxID=2847316 RepID=UPI002ABE75A1|nr:DNA polymerase III subunit delta [Paratractidigestivibacter sp.]
MPANAPLLAAYLAVGPDELKRKEALTRLKARVAGPFEAFNHEEIQVAPDLEPQQVTASLNTLPMGADTRIVVIENADKLPRPVSEAIIAYLRDPNPACTLCLTATTLAKSTRLYKAVAKVGPKAIIDCAAKKGRELGPYVQKLARAHSLTISPDAATELVARVGESSTMLDTQLASLSALLGGGGNVTIDLIEANVARIVEVKPWEFLDRLSQRDLNRSLQLLRLLGDGSPIGLVSLITGRVRELICAQSLAARGESGRLASELKKADWQVRNLFRWANGFCAGELEHLLALCAQTDASLKSGADPTSALTTLVMGFAKHA